MEIVTDDSAERLDVWLASRLPDLSRSRIQTLIREEHILVDSRRAKPRDSIREGMLISISLPEAVPAVAEPQDLPIHVLHEDDDLLVLNKSSGMVVHPAAGNSDGTLVNALLHHCRGKLSGIGGVERPGIVHRLDKDTSGCMVVAKSDVAHASLVSQFAERKTMEKLYLAVSSAVPRPEQDTIFTHIGRHPVNRQKMAVVNPPEARPPSRTTVCFMWMFQVPPPWCFVIFIPGAPIRSACICTIRGHHWSVIPSMESLRRIHRFQSV